jgi:hypothetical protein
MSAPSSHRFPYDEELVDVKVMSKETPTSLLDFVDDNENIASSSADDRDDNNNNIPPPRDAEETDKDRLQREEEESIALAQRIMAEEAMASYQQHIQLLQESAHQLSQEDFDALQNALQEDEVEHVAALEDESGDLSYDTLLELGERIGDVKLERWAMIAKEEVQKLPTFLFDPNKLSGKTELDDSERKCLICQCDYEPNEELRSLPCGHCFDRECVDKWLMTKEVCPYCRQPIIQS